MKRKQEIENVQLKSFCKGLQLFNKAITLFVSQGIVQGNITLKTICVDFRN
jgi:hypothetical protein